MKLAEKVLSLFEIRKIIKPKKYVSDIAADVEDYIKSLRYGIPENRLFDLAVAYLESINDYKSPLSSFRGECLVLGLSDKQQKELWDSLESKFKKLRIKAGSTDSDIIEALEKLSNKLLEGYDDDDAQLVVNFINKKFNKHFSLDDYYAWEEDNSDHNMGEVINSYISKMVKVEPNDLDYIDGSLISSFMIASAKNNTKEIKELTKDIKNAIQDLMD